MIYQKEVFNESHLLSKNVSFRQYHIMRKRFEKNCQLGSEGKTTLDAVEPKR